MYIRPTARDGIYAVHGSLADGVSRPIGDWRDKHIVAVAPDSVSRISIRRPGRSYTLRRAGHSWTFATGRPADSSAVAALLGRYRDLSAVGFASAAQAGSARSSPSDRQARLLRADGSALATLQFDSTPGHVWARADTAGTLYELAGWTLGQLLPPGSTLRPKPPSPSLSRRD